MLQARRSGFDTVLVDTAGRLHIDETLMDELRGLKAEFDAVGDPVRRRLDDGSGRRALGGRVPQGAGTPRV